MAAVLVGMVMASGLALAGPSQPAGATLVQTTCPSATCPYTAPTSTDLGAIENMAVRENLERAAPQRDFTWLGERTALQPLKLLSPTTSAGKTAQAAAEWGAAHGTDADYGGPTPPGYPWGYSTISSLAASGSTARLDGNFMTSFPHAGAILAARPSPMVAIGVACNASHEMVVSEQFYVSTSSTENTGMGTAEIAQNSVYAQSGGKVTKVSDRYVETATAKHVLPTQPVVAGTDNPYAGGYNWTCTGPQAAPGAAPTSPLPGPVISIASSGDGGGYYLANGAGAVSVHGDAQFYGAANGLTLNRPVVQMATTPTGGGYWMVAGDGGIFSFGNAQFYGSMGGRPLNQPVVSMVATADGHGYWEVAADGGIFSFGDAQFYGSMGGKPLNKPVVAMAATPTGGGYWEVAADGGIFSFGNARFYGSMGAKPLNEPVVGMASTPTGRGYWEVAADGGIFAFGNAKFYGSMGGKPLNEPVVGMAATPAGGGYWEVAADGGVFAFGVPFYGSD